MANSVVGSNDEATPRNNIEHSQKAISHSVHNSPNTSERTLTQRDQRKALKVRKVKSEVKYNEPPPKDSSQRKISKSDHEFANESDVSDVSMHFRKEIYDILWSYDCSIDMSG